MLTVPSIIHSNQIAWIVMTLSQLALFKTLLKAYQSNFFTQHNIFSSITRLISTWGHRSLTIVQKFPGASRILSREASTTFSRKIPFVPKSFVPRFEFRSKSESCFRFLFLGRKREKSKILFKDFEKKFLFFRRSLHLRFSTDDEILRSL